MGKEICIDNGGTLTDICVIDGGQVFTTKTLTTPADLSQCFFDGLRKVSAVVYGQENVDRLLTETDSIRYSTTQGTNALVERKGPRLGLVVSDGFTPPADRAPDLFAAIIGDRIASVDPKTAGTAEVIRVAGELALKGASRLVVCFTGTDSARLEQRFQALFDDAFAPHLLGTLPLTLAHETTGDGDDSRRCWTAIFNGFLHPPMENFLFSAQKRLRNFRSAAPLLIFRNDGGSAKVSKTAAIRTYSSGPRAGMEAVLALAERHDCRHVVSVDVGGTTSDLGFVTDGGVASDLRGQVEGVQISLELCHIPSVGVGGGSIIRVADGRIVVGPDSVGAVPGPACFGLGGSRATITDALLVLGILAPESFFGGEMRLDADRAAAVISREIGEPLGLGLEQAALAMEEAWVDRLGAAIRAQMAPTADTVLFSFGGAGPMAVCRLAEKIGVGRVLIPRLAALFCAWGVGFSDVSQHYEMTLESKTPAALKQALAALTARAGRDLGAEGLELGDCHLEARLVSGGRARQIDLDGGGVHRWQDEPGEVSVLLHARKAGSRKAPALHHAEVPAVPATAAGRRTIVGTGEVPVYSLAGLPEGARAMGPAILEGDFFTGSILPGWRFRILSGGDALLERGTA